MSINFDRVVVAVPQLQEAITQYRQLLGKQPLLIEGEARAWWALPNTVIELVQRAVKKPAITGLVLASSQGREADAAVENPLGLDISLCNGSRTAAFRADQAGAPTEDLRVDHVVLRTRDAGACIELFTQRLGVRLALDKTVPQWGGRMLFFRSGKMTLEVIESGDDAPERDFFWGIAYQCPDIASLAATLAGRGVTLSDIRDGRKPGTRVATLKSHDLGIPTLLIEQTT